MLTDLRVALRSLRKSPGFTIVAVLTLALGIAANTTMFSVVYGVLLRPLPYPQPERIVELAQTYHGGREVKAITYAEYRFVQQRRDIFQHVAARTSLGFNLFAGDAAERVRALRVSRAYFRVLGVAPELGREFSEDEDQLSGPAVAILSHGLWQRRFGADPGVVGRTILLDGRPYTVVGVMPPAFSAADDVDLWSTLAQVSRTTGSGQNLRLLGRLRPGLALDRARAAMQAMTAPYREQLSGFLSPEATLDLFAYQDLIGEPFRGPVRLLFGAVAFVLLIACANVANLVLGRAAVREREVAVRVALGAGRGRLIRLLLAESMLLALSGGALGFLLANWGLSGVMAVLPDSLRLGDIRLDRWALGFTVGLSLATGIVFGLVPAWRGTRSDVQETLKEGGARTTEAARRGRLRASLVVGEIALSLVLLVGAGLLIRTFANLLRTDPGFAPDHLLTAEIWLSGTRDDSTAQITGFYDRLSRRLEAFPGVRAVGVVEAGLPLQRGGNVWALIDAQGHSLDYRTVTPGYVPLLGVPLLRGRMLSDADATGAEPVALVNRTLARRFLGDSAAVGRVIAFGGGGTRRVVGVVGDVKSYIGRSASPTLFIPSAQTPAGLTRGFASVFPIHVVMRTGVDPAGLKDAVARIIHETDPAVPVGRMRTMDEVLAGSLASQRFIMLLLSVFAGLAASLAAVGIYGVMSYFTARRTHEIGVRLALGAVPGDVVHLVLRRGMVLVVTGAVLGLAGALALTRVLAETLFGVKTTDPLTLAGTTALLGLVALAACYIPARRAARGDPIEALRYE